MADPSTVQGRIALFAKCAVKSLSLIYQRVKYPRAVPRNVLPINVRQRALKSIELKLHPRIKMFAISLVYPVKIQ